MADAAAAHDATSGGLPSVVDLHPVQGGAPTASCRRCGKGIRPCPGHVTENVRCMGWVHEGGRHDGFLRPNEPHLAAPPGRPITPGRGPAALVVVRQPRLTAQSHAGRDQLDVGSDWHVVWITVRVAAAGILFVVIMVLANVYGWIR